MLLLVIVALAWAMIAPPQWLALDTKQPTSQGNVSNSENANPTTLAGRVSVITPKPNSHVAKYFSVTGKAPGNWYFEASFPVEVQKLDGEVIAQVPAQALTDWMTTDDVAFKADIKVSGYSGPAKLVLKRDNPSGLPQYEESISVPITID